MSDIFDCMSDEIIEDTLPLYPKINILIGGCQRAIDRIKNMGKMDSYWKSRINLYTRARDYLTEMNIDKLSEMELCPNHVLEGEKSLCRNSGYTDARCKSCWKLSITGEEDE